MTAKASNTADLFSKGIEHWAKRIRAGELSFAETVDNCLQRSHDEVALDAFEILDDDNARAIAQSLDKELGQGQDRGLLMGLPIGVKDIMAADGLPTTNGSNADTAHLTGSEGSVVKTLRGEGCIPIGKTKTVEFALGATGVNEARGTPWNPCDRDIHRIPGGSSSGSAVATATGCVGLGLGTDTGGSVRIPACLTGLFGHKTSVGRWPTDGIFPLSPTLDSVGPLCRRASDAALIHEIMLNEPVPVRKDVNGLRVGVPESLFLEELDDEVTRDFEKALDTLFSLGAIRVDMDFPEAAERETLFPLIVPPELLSSLGIDLFLEARGGMDTVTADRAAFGLTVSAVQHIEAKKRQQELISLALKTFNDVDVWVSPTVPYLPMSLNSLNDPAMHKRSLLASRNTQPGNLLEFCAVSIPMHPLESLPTGFQIMMPNGCDAELLSLSVFLEDYLNVHITHA